MRRQFVGRDGPIGWRPFCFQTNSKRALNIRR
nr:MAG TPA: hypothetical protein [Siphoviridae sp. ctKRf14]